MTRTTTVSALGRLAIAVFLAACSPAAPAPSAPAQTSSAPTSAVVATPALTKPPTVSAIAVPETLRGDWLADAPTIEGIGPHDPLIQVSFDWQQGIDFWISVGDQQAVQSHSAASPIDQIHLVSKDAVSGCKVGDEGRYSWSRPGDGLFLEIKLIDDACPLRAELLARTWVHSLQAVNDGGLGIIRASTFLLGTIPDYRFAVSGTDGVTDLHSFDDNDPDVSLVVFDGAKALDAPCSTARQAVSVDPTLDALVAYLHSVPGVTLARKKTTIDGNRAEHLTLTSDAATACPTGAIALFRGRDGAADPEYGIDLGGTYSFWVIQLSDRAVVIWYQGVDAATEQAFFDTLKFLDGLPKP